MSYPPGWSAEDQAVLKQHEQRVAALKAQRTKAQDDARRAKGLTPNRRSHLTKKAIEQLGRLNQRRRALTLVTMSLESEIHDHTDALSVTLAELYDRWGSEHRLVVPGEWGCTGPLGTCIYDDRQDPMHDECLVCHEPQERK